MDAMGGRSWEGKDLTRHYVPHHTFIEKYIRSLPHVKYDSYWGEFFSCIKCLEVALSHLGIVSGIKEAHRAYSKDCFNAMCSCGVFQNRKQTRETRSGKVIHREYCSGRCSCDDCLKFLSQFDSISGFLYSIINKSGGCDLVKGIPKKKCREQTCSNCKLSELMNFENAQKTIGCKFELPLSLPSIENFLFIINTRFCYKPARTYLSTKTHRKIERPDEEVKIYSFKHTMCKIVPFQKAWSRFWISHPDRKVPFARMLQNIIYNPNLLILCKAIT